MIGDCPPIPLHRSPLLEWARAPIGKGLFVPFHATPYWTTQFPAIFGAPISSPLLSDGAYRGHATEVMIRVRIFLLRMLISPIPQTQASTPNPQTHISNSSTITPKIQSPNPNLQSPNTNPPQPQPPVPCQMEGWKGVRTKRRVLQKLGRLRAGAYTLNSNSSNLKL